METSGQLDLPPDIIKALCAVLFGGKGSSYLNLPHQ